MFNHLTHLLELVGSSALDGSALDDSALDSSALDASVQENLLNYA